MKLVYIFLAMVLMIGISAASFEVRITYPEEGADMAIGKAIVPAFSLQTIGEKNVSVRLLVGGVPSPTLYWMPKTEGEYVLTIQAANNSEFVGAASDSVAVYMYEPEPGEEPEPDTFSPPGPFAGSPPPSGPSRPLAGHMREEDRHTYKEEEPDPAGIPPGM
jgi:hypothetical protein